VSPFWIRHVINSFCGRIGGWVSIQHLAISI
jgi:hypothetical protein